MNERKEVPGEPEYARIIRDMHDQKSGDFDPDTMTQYDAFSKDYDKYLSYLRFLESEEFLWAYKQVLEVRKRIEEYGISPPHNTPENLEALEKIKEEAYEMINSVEEAAVKYISVIYLMWSYYEIYSPDGKVLPEDRIEGLHDLDDQRKQAHNHLIDTLRKTNEQLRSSFGEEVISEDELQGEALNNIEVYEHLDREYVAKWAYQLVRAKNEKKLPDLEKEF